MGVFGLDDAAGPETAELALSDEEIDQLVAERDLARSERRFADADDIRDRLDEIGVVLEDSPDGTRWLRK